ncbi:hypothetical protein [Serratia marcescens]|uniref:hypothetical protein n=1 Tax=Serratia marcescens TaxID=615 RepID=UPI0028816C69|nr:hypothetical protein [Serratia marcescens]MDT0208481.1 hypothetical protein [Serratia marcescens]
MEDNGEPIVVGKTTRTRLSIVGGTESAFSIGYDTSSTTRKEEVEVSDISKVELQALLKANKAEVDAVASSMRADMAKWREVMSSDMKEIKSIITSQNASISSRLDLQSEKISSVLDGHSKKIDAALSVQEAKLEVKLTDMKLDIIKWALGLPALAFAVYKIYGAIAGHPTP